MGSEVAETDDKQEEPSSDIDPEDYDVESFRQVMEDVRSAHQYEIQSLAEKRDKAWRTIQFNGLFATVLVAVVTQTTIHTPLDPAGKWTLSLGAAFLLTSTVAGFYTQRNAEITIGPSHGAVDYIQTGNCSEVEYLGVYSKKYVQWREEIAGETNDREIEVYYTIIASLIGVVLLLSGVFLVHTP